jgi:hypothetical protein
LQNSQPGWLEPKSTDTDEGVWAVYGERSDTPNAFSYSGCQRTKFPRILARLLERVFRKPATAYNLTRHGVLVMQNSALPSILLKQQHGRTYEGISFG